MNSDSFEYTEDGYAESIRIIDGVRQKTYYKHATTDKDATIRVFMHYTDHDANREVSVFGSKREGLSYNYSDRLCDWDYEKWKAGQAIAKSQGVSDQTARYYEIALSHFHNSPCNLEHIILGCNRSNGFHYLVFGYTYEEKKGTQCEQPS